MNGSRNLDSALRLETARPGRPPWILLVAAKSWSWLLRARRTKRARAALHALDDRMLKDIGVSRSEIEWVAEHGALRAAMRLRSAAPPGQQPAPSGLSIGGEIARPPTKDADDPSAPIDLASVRARLRRASAQQTANDSAGAPPPVREFERLHHFLL